MGGRDKYFTGILYNIDLWSPKESRRGKSCKLTEHGL